MLTPWVIGGLALGVINDYVLIRHGLKPAMVLMTSILAISYGCWWMGEVKPVYVAVMLAALATTQYVARPLLKRYLGRSEVSAGR